MIKEALIAYFGLKGNQKDIFEDENIIVTAPAGSGKTRCLAARYVYLVLEKGLPVDSVLCVTYTKKAAAEMKERIRKAFLDIYYAPEGSGIRKELENRGLELKEKALNDILALDGAPISTFHSFANDVIASMPVDFECGPDAEFLEGEAFEYFFGLFLDGELNRIAEKRGAVFGKVMKLIDGGLELVKIKQAVSSIISGWHEKGYGRGLGAFYAETRLRYMENIVFEKRMGFSCRGEFVEAFKGQLRALAGKYSGRDFTPKAQAAVDDFTGFFNRNDRGFGLEEIRELLAPNLTSDMRLRRSGKGEKQENAEEFNREVLMPLFEEGAWEEEECLFEIAEEINESMLEELSGKSILTYSRILELLEEKLRSDPSVRTRLHERFKAFLVDEFQDSNEQQRSIIFNMAKEDDESGTLMPGKLFIVGDPKQSIYFFRNSDVSVFNRTVDDFKRKGFRSVGLDMNFRSGNGIIGYVNKSFRPFLTASGEDPYEVDYGPDMKAGNAERKGTVYFEETEDKDIAPVIDAVKHALHDGYAFKDIALLFCARSGDYGEVKKALRAENIPLRDEDALKISDFSPLFSVIQYIKALANPYDDMWFLEFLKSDLFFIDDITLFKISQCKGNYLYERAEEYFYGYKSNYVGIFETFNHLLGLKNILKPDRVVELIISENRYADYLGMFEDAEILASGLEEIKHRARELFTGNLFNFYDLAFYLESNLSSLEFSIPPSENDNAVRLMTVHKSKGLEFPVVVFSQFNKIFPERRREAACEFYYDPEGIACKALKNGFYEKIKDNYRHKERLEKKRLLYVALTRAEERLYLLSPKGKFEAVDLFSVPESRFERMSRPPAAIPERRKAEKVAVEPSAKAEVMSVSSFLDKICGRTSGKDITAYAAKKGTLLHRLLASENKGIETILATERSEDVIRDAMRVYEKFLSSGLCRTLNDGSSNILRECDAAGYFIHEGKKYFLYGRIDAVIFKDDGIHIVDYKTRISADLLERDRKQLEIYGSILSAEGKKVFCHLIDLTALEETVF